MRVSVSITLFAVALLVGGADPRTLLLVYLAAITAELCIIDLREYRLPNRFVLPGYGIALVAACGQWWVTGEPPVLAAVSGAAYGGFLLLLCASGGMGMGDVKLAGVLGIGAGLMGAPSAIASPVLAFLAGGVVAVAQLLRGVPGARIAFGPYLLAGFWVALLLSSGASST